LGHEPSYTDRLTGGEQIVRAAGPQAVRHGEIAIEVPHVRPPIAVS
jgi:hypothetical protein